MSSTAPSWISVSRETQTKLEQYAQLLEKWNGKINLVSRETISHLWQRHIWDSAQLITLIPPSVESIIDLGSGAGLPGLVLAILAKTPITLVERDQRKCAFLIEAVRALDLKHVTIINKDIKNITEKYGLVTARALASLSELCELSHALLGTNSICLFPKGKNFATEILDAKKNWSFNFSIIQSKTNSESVIISLSELKFK